MSHISRSVEYSHMYILVILQESRKTEEWHMWYIQLSWWNGKISCAHTTFYFFNIVKLINSFGIIFLWKSAVKCAILYFQKKSILPKWRIRLNCTDPAIYFLVKILPHTYQTAEENFTQYSYLLYSTRKGKGGARVNCWGRQVDSEGTGGRAPCGGRGKADAFSRAKIMIEAHVFHYYR